MAMKLLVVDDELEVSKAIKTLLESLGYEVLALTDGREAAQRVDRQKFDGVFLDAQMPHLDGPSLARLIRTSASNSSVPIFMLTGYDDVETMRAGFRAGITFLMAKPLDLKQLGGVLRMMQGPMLREKRSYLRVPLRTVVNCRTGETQFKSTSLNMAEGGILLEPSGGLKVGDVVELRFSLPQIPVVLNPLAKVVRKEPLDRIAVQFLEFNAEDRKAVQDFIARLVKE